MFSQIRKRGVSQPQYYASVEKALIDNAVFSVDQLVRIERVEEISEADFRWFVGKHRSILNKITVPDWYPLLDSDDDIENFISVDNSPFLDVKQFDIDDYEFHEKEECFRYRVSLAEKFDDILVKYFFDEKCSSISEFSSIRLDAEVRLGLDNILTEIYDGADDSESLEELKDRLDVSCEEYDFPHSLIEKLDLE